MEFDKSNKEMDLAEINDVDFIFEPVEEHVIASSIPVQKESQFNLNQFSEPMYSKFDVIKWQEKKLREMNEEHERLNPTVKRIRTNGTNHPRVRSKKSDMQPGIR